MISKKHGMIDLNAPRYIYKYQSINENSISNLKNKILWASEAKAFNDPFEFQYSVAGENPERNNIDKLFKEFERMKVLCLSEDPRNILMWSHYTNQHTGMCLGFYNDTYSMPVNYSNEFPHVDFNSQDGRNRIQEFMKIITTKSKVWEYEQERRQIYMNNGPNQIKYPGELFMVAFGMRAKEEEIEKVKKIISDKDVLFYRCKPFSGQYKIDFQNT